MPFKDPTSPVAIASMRASKRKYYEANKQAYLDRAKKAQREVSLWVRQQKEVPCSDCGVQYPYYVMEFDHVRGEKVANIGHTKWHSVTQDFGLQPPHDLCTLP
jgi:hypothetical protein